MTYSQYRKANRRVFSGFSYSDTSSAVLNPDQWNLNEEDAVLQVVFSEEVRKNKRRNLTIWAIVTGIIFMYISFLLTYFWKQWTTNCIRQLSVWLLVYDCIIILQLVRALFLLRIWKTSADPSLY